MTAFCGMLYAPPERNAFDAEAALDRHDLRRQAETMAATEVLLVGNSWLPDPLHTPAFA